jgi:cell division protein FtsL
VGVRFAMVIVSLAAIAVSLVHIRRAEITARHDIQSLQLRQVEQRRRMWDQQVRLGQLTAPAQIRKRAEEMSLGLVQREEQSTATAPKRKPVRRGNN